VFSSLKTPSRFCQPANTNQASKDAVIERKLTLFQKNLPSHWMADFLFVCTIKKSTSS